MRWRRKQTSINEQVENKEEREDERGSEEGER